MVHELPMPTDHRELTDAIERTERLGDAIEEALDGAERELAEIRRVVSAHDH